MKYIMVPEDRINDLLNLQLDSQQSLLRKDYEKARLEQGAAMRITRDMKRLPRRTKAAVELAIVGEE